MKPEIVIKLFKSLKDRVDELPKVKSKPINKFLSDNASKIAQAPASTHKDGHCCYAGGLLAHTMHVIKVAEEIRATYFPFVKKDDVFFCALFHYMGKIGDEKHVLYVEQNDQYYNNRLGFLYKENEKIDFALAQDRTLYLLAKYNIPVSKDEWYALRNYGGTFHRENYSYVKHFTDLATVLQLAVQISTRLERNAGKKFSQFTEEKLCANN